MPDILANGIRIHYEEEGSGFPMVLAHGLCATLHEWDETVEFFRGRYRVIAYDARGHGRSEVPDRIEAYSQDIMVEDLRAVMDNLGVDRAILGGHSMGADVVLHFALQQPKRCAALVPVGTGGGSSDSKGWHEWMGKLADLAEREGMEAFWDLVKGQPSLAASRSDPRLGPRIAQELLDSSPRGMSCAIRGVLLTRPSILDLESQLKGLSVNTLVVLGELDTPVAEASQFMARHIPGASLLAIPGVGHEPQLEVPEAFLGAVERFLDGVAIE